MIGPSPACPRLINVAAIRSTGLSASLGIAEHVVGAGRRAGRRARATSASCRRPDPERAERPSPGGAAPAAARGERPDGRAAAARDRRGHDRGQGGALRRASCSPVGEARRDKVNRHPQAGWVEQDGDEVLAAVVEAVAELLADPPGEVVACGLDHQGESVLAWDAESGEPLTPDRRLAGQALAGGARPARRARGRGQGGERAALRPLLLRRQARLAARARRRGRRAPATRARCGWGRSTRSSATASAPASPPTPRPRRAPSCSGSTRRASTPASARSSASRPRCCPRSATPRASSASSRHPSWPAELPLCGQTVDQQAALAGAGAVVPGRVKATYGTGVFVLAHVGERGPASRPAACCRRSPGAIDGRIEYALDGGVFAAGAMLEWLCRELGVAADPPALGELARERRGLRRRPGAARAGRARGAVVAARRARRARRDRAAARPAPRSRARRSRASPGGSPTSSRRSARPSTSTASASTAGSPTSR